MITLIVGQNWYVAEQALKRIIAQFEGEPERLDAAAATPSDVVTALTSLSLFSTKRLIIYRGLSDNKDAWSALAEHIDTIGSDTHIVLVEAKVDKRTKTYKQISRAAEVVDAAAFSARDKASVVAWIDRESAARSMTLSAQQKNLLIERSLVPGDKPGHLNVDAGLLAGALDKLSVFDAVTDERIADVLPPAENENIFELFEAVLSRNPRRVDEMCRVLEQTDAPQMVLGLLIGQVAQLTALVVAEVPSDKVAKDIGAHPFVLSKLAPYARNMSRRELSELIETLATTDHRSKTSSGDDWTALWRALISIAQRERA